MYILGKRVDQLDEADIVRLMNNEIPESKILDYKRDLKISQDKDKKEFLYDISAMYNTEGGTIIFGIEENKDDNGQNTGTPRRLVGVAIENIDKLVQQLEDIIRANTDPSIPNIVVKVIDVNHLQIIALGIAKRYGLPSMVTFNESNKFYRRKNSGKYAVDVHELNIMFMQNMLIKESAEKFRYARIKSVRVDSVFPNLLSNPSFFLQIIPFSFMNESILDLTSVREIDFGDLMWPLQSSGYNKMYNYDGFATYSSDTFNRQCIVSYDQIFRNGIYEVYTSQLFKQNTNKKGVIVHDLIGDLLISNSILKVKNGLSVLNKMQIEPPFIVFMSIHGIMGGSIAGVRGSLYEFSANDMFLPPAIFYNFEERIDRNLKPIFDIIWQSVGHSSSPNKV